MKTGLITAGALVLVALAPPAWAQAPRQDVIWARTTQNPITLNGLLSETAWTSAESLVVRYGQDAGSPGSGWKSEGGIAVPTDPTHATFKFLIYGNTLYVGAKVRDKSIGGSKDFNRFDGLLMSLKDHAATGAPKPPSEYFYAWWYPTTTDPQPAGQGPAFIGRWAEWPPGTPRTPAQISAWDAVTVVHGLSNSDTSADTDWTVEMKFDLTPMGYDVTKEEGDVVEWNVSIYDNDYFWPLDVPRFCANRVWYQNPWGNASWFNEARIYARPDITVSSGPVPNVGPEVYVPNGTGYSDPVIDGNLNEAVWTDLGGIDIRYNDPQLRQTYPGVGPYRSGEYQATVNGGTADVVDPTDATVKMFFKGDFLYLGFDMRDQVVQFHPNIDRWDGAMLLINERSLRGPDNQILGRRLSFQVGANGAAVDHDYLSTLIGNGTASLALQLKAGTTVDTLGLSADTGYTAELKIDLKALGYPAGLGDGTVWLGLDILDGDSFIPFTDSYGTRTWWFRQYEGECCPPWGYLAPNLFVSDVAGPIRQEPVVLTSSFPNPGEQTTISYVLTQPAKVELEVFDVQGRMIEERELGLQTAGTQSALFDGTNRVGGLYLYRVILSDPASGERRETLDGRLVVVH
ncbi:MAG: T9SS type A sorting domain-containing protein [Candidatus Eisenbacteria bacterium]|nr:T9SS type A sorting domain-containing protein [Candidatus Eisenbacteria bacterium]MCC7140956.1 T9SS type A sorting domain-containing protein [Candidatus Eisenbacteria bacterium]